MRFFLALALALFFAPSMQNEPMVIANINTLLSIFIDQVGAIERAHTHTQRGDGSHFYLCRAYASFYSPYFDVNYVHDAPSTFTTQTTRSRSLR